MILLDSSERARRSYHRRMAVAGALAMAAHVATFLLAPPYVARSIRTDLTPLRLLDLAAGDAPSSRASQTAPSAPGAEAPRAFTEEARWSAASRSEEVVSEPASAAAATPAGSRSGASGAERQGIPGGLIEGDAPPAFYAYDTPPRATRRVVPDYPSIAREAGAGGMVVVNVNVDERGRILRAWVAAKEGPDALASAALDAAYQFEFAPGSQNGNPVKCTVAIPFQFSVNLIR